MKKIILGVTAVAFLAFGAVSIAAATSGPETVNTEVSADTDTDKDKKKKKKKEKAEKKKCTTNSSCTGPCKKPC